MIQTDSSERVDTRGQSPSLFIAAPPPMSDDEIEERVMEAIELLAKDEKRRKRAIRHQVYSDIAWACVVGGAMAYLLWRYAI